MTYGEGFVRRAKCLLVAVWHTGAVLDGSSRLATHYVKFELALDSDFTPWMKTLNLLSHQWFYTGPMSADPEHEGFMKFLIF